MTTLVLAWPELGVLLPIARVSALFWLVVGRRGYCRACDLDPVQVVAELDPPAEFRGGQRPPLFLLPGHQRRHVVRHDQGAHARAGRGRRRFLTDEW